MTTLTRVQHYLAEFESTDDLAETCRFKRLKGTPLCTTHCIVAELIRDAFPEVAHVEVMPDCDPNNYCGELWIDGRKGILPIVVCDFALAFDDGNYWDLIEPAARVAEPPDDNDDTDEWETEDDDEEDRVYGEPVGVAA